MAILCIKSGLLPDFRFEWHPDTKRVYLIRLAHVPHVGEILAFDVENHGAAINSVNVWARGYRCARSEMPLDTLVT